MKRWAEEMMLAFEACDSKAVLGMLSIGFPANTPLRKKSASGRVLISRTFCAHQAAEYGFVDVLRTLIDMRTDLELPDAFGRTPLLVAADIGEIEPFKVLLHEGKAKATARDREGNTIMHISSLNCHLTLVKYLIEVVRFPIHLKNTAGQTALEACERKHEQSSVSVQVALDSVIAFLSSIKQAGYHSVPQFLKPKEAPAKTKSIHRHCIHRFQQAEWAKAHGMTVEDARKADASGHKLTFQLVAHETLAPLQTHYNSAEPVEKGIQSKCQEIYDRFVGSRIIFLDQETRPKLHHVPTTQLASTISSRLSQKAQSVL